MIIRMPFWRVLVAAVGILVQIDAPPHGFPKPADTRTLPQDTAFGLHERLADHTLHLDSTTTDSLAE